MASDLELADESIRALRAIVSSLLEGGDSKAESGVPGQRTASAWTGVWLAGGDAGTRAAAAETLARDLRKRLYRIDLRASAGRYIGETEKNLDRVLQAAGDVDVLLFVDEADELFGSRTDVKDAHDRYANIEVSYLLQRMEAYRGLAILTTNQKTALDPAFLRRLRFVVQFPVPDAEEREAIWRRTFPDHAPLADVDCAKLARLHATGGSIRNIALNAAFLAAEAGEPIGMRHLLDAARGEAGKRERVLTEGETRGWA
jgi:SpoVK/Ycf46/Vps4 family AAA+-type ATPase